MGIGDAGIRAENPDYLHAAGVIEDRAATDRAIYAQVATPAEAELLVSALSERRLAPVESNTSILGEPKIRVYDGSVLFKKFPQDKRSKAPAISQRRLAAIATTAGEEIDAFAGGEDALGTIIGFNLAQFAKFAETLRSPKVVNQPSIVKKMGGIINMPGMPMVLFVGTDPWEKIVELGKDKPSRETVAGLLGKVSTGASVLEGGKVVNLFTRDDLNPAREDYGRFGRRRIGI